MDTDSILIKQVKAGNEMAAERVLRKYQERILGYLYMMLHDFQDAQDATQDTFVAALNTLHRYEEQGCFKSWLFRIAQRQGLRILRKRKRFISLMSDHKAQDIEACLDVNQCLPAEEIAKREKAGKVYEAINKLPVREKQVLLLRIKGELSFHEIADVTGCPLNTVLGRMHNATQRLKKSFQGETP